MKPQQQQVANNQQNSVQIPVNQVAENFYNEDFNPEPLHYPSAPGNYM